MNFNIVSIILVLIFVIPIFLGFIKGFNYRSGKYELFNLEKDIVVLVTIVLGAINSNIILNSDIVIPEGKIINLYYRGYKITRGNYTITNNGTVNVKDEDTSGGILGTIKALLNIEDNNISKNVIVYQMDDGSILSSVEDYTLESLVNGKYEKINYYSIKCDAFSRM